MMPQLGTWEGLELLRVEWGQGGLVGRFLVSIVIFEVFLRAFELITNVQPFADLFMVSSS